MFATIGILRLRSLENLMSSLRLSVTAIALLFALKH